VDDVPATERLALFMAAGIRAAADATPEPIARPRRPRMTAEAEAITLFLPAWNEAGALPDTVLAAHAHLSSTTSAFAIIVIDDGSTDDTPRVMAGLAERHPQISTVRHATNLGYGAALRTGFKAGLSTGHPWVAYCDADGQFDPADVSVLVAAAEEQKADLAIGYRIRRADSALRRAMGWGWHLISRAAVGVDVRDVDCGFKAFRREALTELEPRLFGDYATISPELLARAEQARMRIVEVGLAHAPRESGESSGSSLRVVLGSLRALAGIRRSLRMEDRELPAAPEPVAAEHERRLEPQEEYA
jgi:glycosyltransferase involved in cell wall biosynthesis